MGLNGPYGKGEKGLKRWPRPSCRGIVTADVLELGLSRGAIAARKLEGVNAGQGT